jgi:hypothetical protein
VINLHDNSTSTDNIEHITDGIFDPSQVTVGYVAKAGSIAPNGVSRTTFGKTVAFGFNGSDNIMAGDTIDTLVIQTSRTIWTPGNFVVADDVGGLYLGLGDAVPEPTTQLLLGGGLALIGFARWRSRKNKK